MKMYIKPLTKQKLAHYLSIKDLTKDKNHAIGLLAEKIINSVKSSHPASDIRIYRKDPIVTVADNYDALGITTDNITRSSTYTHYIDETHLLQCHTTAQIPSILRELATTKDQWNDVVILVPGLAYRRDVTDKKHVGEVHMIDIWRVVKNNGNPPINKQNLLKVVESIAKTAAPSWQLRIIDSPHPYTEQGIEVNAVQGDRDIEILECGLIKPQILSNAGLDPAEYSGWASGLGLDRLVMTLKGLPDIRYLRSQNPKIAEQMKDLATYHEVSNQPTIKRDMSYSVPAKYVEEDISDEIREALGEQQNILESVKILSETPYENLPEKIRERLGISKNQKNILVRITLRDLTRTLEKTEANQIYNDIYTKINHSATGYI